MRHRNYHTLEQDYLIYNNGTEQDSSVVSIMVLSTADRSPG